MAEASKIYMSLFSELDMNNLFLEYKDDIRQHLLKIFEGFYNYCNDIKCENKNEKELREDIIRTGNDLNEIVKIMRSILPIEILNHDTYIAYWFQCAKVLNEVYNSRNV